MGVWKTIRSLWRTAWKLLFTGWRALRGAPLVGEIKGRYKAVPAVITGDPFGESSAEPQVLEIIVSDEEQWPLGVGKIVNEIFYDKAPPIIFNVCFSCHRPDESGRSKYADPTSHWFNVFFGFYEIDVPASEWGRPFGFKTDDEENWEVEFDDLVRIGKADWNYFSNYMYGVPWWKACGCNRLDDPGVETRITGQRLKIRGQRYIECEVDGMEVVSAYCAGDEELRRNVTFFTKFWQKKFGTCEPNPKYGESFFPVRMKMRFLIGWKPERDFDLKCDAFKTFIYGGSINKTWAEEFDREAFNEEFLEAQMAAVKEAAERMEQPEALRAKNRDAGERKPKSRRPR